MSSLQKVTVLGLVLLAACGGEGITEPAGVDPSEPPPREKPTGLERTVKQDPNYENDIQEVFERRGCSAATCHGTRESAGLLLTSEDSYGELVNVDATQGGIRVVPGNAGQSYLMVKLLGTQNVGQRMPIGGAPLDSIDIENIRRWIDNGAANAEGIRPPVSGQVTLGVVPGSLP